MFLTNLKDRLAAGKEETLSEFFAKRGDIVLLPMGISSKTSITYLWQGLSLKLGSVRMSFLMAPQIFKPCASSAPQSRAPTPCSGKPERQATL